MLPRQNNEARSLFIKYSIYKDTHLLCRARLRVLLRICSLATQALERKDHRCNSAFLNDLLPCPISPYHGRLSRSEFQEGQVPLKASGSCSWCWYSWRHIQRVVNMICGQYSDLEPLAEVERALLVVEVLHLPHPKFLGLLRGGEHSCARWPVSDGPGTLAHCASASRKGGRSEEAHGREDRRRGGSGGGRGTKRAASMHLRSGGEQVEERWF